MNRTSRTFLGVRRRQAGQRFAETKVVYCKDDDRRRRYPNEKFDFLGYGFEPRRSKNRFGKYFINFSPAISDKAGKSIREKIRSRDLHLRSDKSTEDLSRMFFGSHPNSDQQKKHSDKEAAKQGAEEIIWAPALR